MPLVFFWFVCVCVWKFGLLFALETWEVTVYCYTVIATNSQSKCMHYMCLYISILPLGGGGGGGGEWALQYADNSLFAQTSMVVFPFQPDILLWLAAQFPSERLHCQCLHGRHQHHQDPSLPAGLAQRTHHRLQQQPPVLGRCLLWQVSLLWCIGASASVLYGCIIKSLYQNQLFFPLCLLLTALLSFVLVISNPQETPVVNGL